jgi:hypothetical protein
MPQLMPWIIVAVLCLVFGCAFLLWRRHRRSAEVQGRRILAAKLAEKGLDMRQIPDACLQEMADVLVRRVKVRANQLGAPWETLLPNHINNEASAIADILQCRSFEPVLQAYIKEFQDILSNHKVPIAGSH